MKAEYLGINPETRNHRYRFTWHETTALDILADHGDSKNKISRAGFTKCFSKFLAEHDDSSPLSMRQSQELIDHLIIYHHQPILTKAGPTGGYWLSKSKDEAREFLETFQRRGKSAFIKGTRGQRGVMVQLVKQFVFDFDKTAQLRGRALMTPYQIKSAPAAVITAFIEDMAKDREKYDADLKLLGEKHGKVLMPRESFVRLRSLSQELAGLLEKMT